MTKDVDLIFMAWALDFERSDGGRYVGVSLFIMVLILLNIEGVVITESRGDRRMVGFPANVLLRYRCFKDQCGERGRRWDYGSVTVARSCMCTRRVASAKVQGERCWRSPSNRG